MPETALVRALAHADRVRQGVPTPLVLCPLGWAEHQRATISSVAGHPAGGALLPERRDALLALLAREEPGRELQQLLEPQRRRTGPQQPLGLGQRGRRPGGERAH